MIKSLTQRKFSGSKYLIGGSDMAVQLQIVNKLKLLFLCVHVVIFVVIQQILKQFKSRQWVTNLQLYYISFDATSFPWQRVFLHEAISYYLGHSLLIHRAIQLESYKPVNSQSYLVESYMLKSYLVIELFINF